MGQPTTTEIPDSIFKVPEQQETQLNADYYKGYDAAKQMKTKILSPVGFKDYEAYKAECEKQFYKKATDTGFPINYNVGYNNCIADMFNYVWTHDPQSPHKKPPA